MIFLHIILWNLYLREYTKGQIQLNLVKISISRTLIVTTNKLNRLRWAGHIIHTDENYHPKQILLGRCSNNRSRGREKLWWIDSVFQDWSAGTTMQRGVDDDDDIHTRCVQRKRRILTFFLKSTYLFINIYFVPK